MAIDAINAPLQDLQGEKSCTKCGEVKPLSEFHQDKNLRSGYRSQCKVCMADASANRRKLNPEYMVEWRAKNAKRISELNREKWKSRDSKFVAQKRLSDKAHYAKNRERRKAAVAKYASENREKVRNASYVAKKKQRDANPLYWRDYYVKSMSRPSSRISNSIRSRISKTLKTGGKFGAKTFDTLGYSSDELACHIEKQFTLGMSWGNYGQWHIDHIIPLSAFNFETVKDGDFRRAWALDNLRPLWAFENLSKASKITETFQPSLLI